MKIIKLVTLLTLVVSLTSVVVYAIPDPPCIGGQFQGRFKIRRCVGNAWGTCNPELGAPYFQETASCAVWCCPGATGTQQYTYNDCFDPVTLSTNWVQEGCCAFPGYQGHFVDNAPVNPCNISPNGE
jgi:hypothetical protein